jgi:hypothetical protein
VAGELFDRAVLHWVAETSVEAFLERVAGVLEREALSVGLTAGRLPAVPAVPTAGWAAAAWSARWADRRSAAGRDLRP